MPELRRVVHAEMSPMTCITCGDHQGPFVDLEVDLPIYGHVYLCASNSSRPGCARQIGRMDEMIELESYRELELKIAELNTDIDTLVERLRGEKLVSLAEAMELVGGR